MLKVAVCNGLCSTAAASYIREEGPNEVPHPRQRRKQNDGADANLLPFRGVPPRKGAGGSSLAVRAAADVDGVTQQSIHGGELEESGVGKPPSGCA